MNWFDLLALLANFGSLVGFALTLYVYYRVRKLREHYALIGRVPADADRLKRMASELAGLNYAEVSRQELLGTLGEMKAALESIARNIGSHYSPDYLNCVIRLTALRERGNWMPAS